MYLYTPGGAVYCIGGLGRDDAAGLVVHRCATTTTTTEGARGQEGEEGAAAGLEWEEVRVRGVVPAARAHHTANLVGDKIYVFGGVDRRDNALGDLCAFSLETKTWETLWDAAGEYTYMDAEIGFSLESLTEIGSSLLGVGGGGGAKVGRRKLDPSLKAPGFKVLIVKSVTVLST